MKWTIWLMWECWGGIFWRRLIPRIFSSILVWEPRAEGAFGKRAACRRYSMSTACVRGLCWDAAAYFLFFCTVHGQCHTLQNWDPMCRTDNSTYSTLQCDAFSFEGVEMHTDSAFDRSTHVEMHRLKWTQNWRYAPTVVLKCASYAKCKVLNVFYIRISEQAV